MAKHDSSPAISANAMELTEPLHLEHRTIPTLQFFFPWKSTVNNQCLKDFWALNKTIIYCCTQLLVCLIKHKENTICQLISWIFFIVICHIVSVTLCTFKAILCISENPEKITLVFVWIFISTSECWVWHFILAMLIKIRSSFYASLQENSASYYCALNKYSFGYLIIFSNRL